MKLTLLGQTGDPMDLEDALITFDRKVGFTIEEGKLIHHNGIVTCKAEFGDDAVEEERFHLVFRDSIQLNFNRMFNRFFNRAQDTL